MNLHTCLEAVAGKGRGQHSLWHSYSSSCLSISILRKLFDTADDVCMADFTSFHVIFDFPVDECNGHEVACKGECMAYLLK